jgi:hypothetical protein
VGSLGLLLAGVLLRSPVAPPPPPPPPEAVEPAPAESAEEPSLEQAAEESPPAAEEAPAVAAVEEEAVEPAPVGYTDLGGALENFDGLGWLRVSVRSTSMRPRRGYAPLEITLQNGDAVPHPVTLEFRGHSASTPKVTRMVELGPRQRLVTNLLLPASVASGSVHVKGPGTETAHANSVYLYQPDGLRALVVGNRQGLEQGTGLPRAEEEQPSHVGALFFPAQQAPRELAAYVGYDLVMVTEEVARLPPDLWATLEHHAAAGGALMLVQPPRDVLQRLPLLSARDAGALWQPYGLGQVALCAPERGSCSAALNALSVKRGLPIVPLGFGPQIRLSRYGEPGPSENPLLSNALAPLGRFLVLIFLFTLMVGPGGLYLARRKGPVALLLGVPAVALATCLLIIADSVLREGFVTHAARYSYSLLDRPRDRVITAAVAGYYANLSPEALQVPAQGVLLEAEDGPELEPGLDWSSGGMRAEGFLPSRTYVEWGELTVAPTRARLIVRAGGSGLQVQNALGAPLQAGFVRLNGVDYVLPGMDEGGQALAPPAPAGQAPVHERWPVVSPLTGRTGPQFSFLRPLEEGEFIARLGGGGFGFMTALPVELHEGVHYMRGKVDSP